MKVTLICVGKVKEKFYRDAIKEYEKRLGAYIKTKYNWNKWWEK